MRDTWDGIGEEQDFGYLFKEGINISYSENVQKTMVGEKPQREHLKP